MTLTSIVLSLLACTPGRDTGAGSVFPSGPGSEAWGEEDISCDAASECLVGETCEDGVCQPSRCQGGPYTSKAPVGENFVFFQENEVGLADTVEYERSYWVDGYAPGASTLAYDYSWEAGGEPISDIAGGSFDGNRPETYVASFEGRNEVAVLGGTAPQYHDVGIVPVALAAGDSDSDGTDEVLAVNDSDVVLCDLLAQSCKSWEFTSSLQVKDASMGDIDGDNFEEVVILLEMDDEAYLYVINVDWETTGQVDYYAGWLGDDVPERITVADLDGDFLAEIIGLVDGGYWDWVSDGLAMYTTYEGSDGGEVTLEATFELDGSELIDIAAADLDADDEAEVMVLDASGDVTSLTYAPGGFSKRFQVPAGVSVAPHRIALADHDGDGPRARLVEGPTDCAGAMLPMALLMAPPYDERYSEETSTVFFGDGDATSISESETVSLGASVDIGYGASLFDLFKADAGVKLGIESSTTVGTAQSMFANSYYDLIAEPDRFGPDYGAVVLTWACFQGYVYEIDDPNDHLGENADGERFAMTVPVDSAVSIWSTTRYNTLAEELGNLPIIPIPHSMGDPSSYYSEARDLLGEPVPESDQLFPVDQVYVPSDVGVVSWWLGAESTTTNEQNLSVDLGAHSEIAVGGIQIGTEVSAGWSSSYSLSVGEYAAVGGALPAIYDDPGTPEDEYADNLFSVEPYVYLQPWGDDDDPAYFYVIDYAVHTQ